MTSFNYRMNGYLFRKVLRGNLSSLNMSQYKELLRTQINTSEKEYSEFILLRQPEIQIRSKKDDFIVCLRIVKFNFGLCDKASTNFIDKVLNQEEMSKELEIVLSELENM